MRLWSRMRSWWAALRRRPQMESEMDAELRFHIEAYADDLVGRGVPSGEAMRRAQARVRRRRSRQGRMPGRERSESGRRLHP